MAFQQDTLTTPLHSYVFFHILLLSVITLQMKWLMMKGLTRCWTLPLHSWRTSVVWLTDGLDVWQTDCGEVWTGILLGGERPERTCHVSSADMETHKRTEEQKRGEKERESEIREIEIYALCAMWMHSCMCALWLQRYSELVSFAVFCPSCPVLCIYVSRHRSVAVFTSYVMVPGPGPSGARMDYDCSGKSCPHSSSICNIQRTRISTRCAQGSCHHFSLRTKLRISIKLR